MAARRWTVGLAIGAVLAAAGAPVAAAAAGPGGDRPAQVRRAPLPEGLGPCVPAPGGTCPSPFPPIGSDGVIRGRDNAVNIFVGGDFRVRERVSEAEGRLVVLGSFDQNKSGQDLRYNIGVVGAGSLVPPSPGADFLTTGANVTVAAGQRLIADGGRVRYAGTLSGTVTGTLTPDPAAAAPYAGWRDSLSAASQCYARVDGRPRTPTGTAVNSGSQTTFTGDNTSPLQVFNVNADLVSGSGNGQQGIVFQQIPAGATILVNVFGAARTINTYSGTIQDNLDPLNAYRERLLWNFPDAATVDLNGTGQFQGSFLIGNRASETSVRLPGINGRFFTTGSLTHTSAATGGGGQEFHAYPFNGDLPDCGGTPQPVTGAVSVLKRDEAGRPLAGAVFELWRETNGTPGLQTGGPGADTRVGADCVTPANGVCSRITTLGTYYWRETQAPPGYELPPATTHRLELTAANAEAGVQVQVDNDRTPEIPDASITVRKTDAETGAPLAGATFELWRESNGRPGLQTTANGVPADTRLGTTCVTDTRGRCTVTVPIGQTYYWRETATPAGYQLPADPVTRFEPTEADLPEGIVVTIPNRRTQQEYEGSIRVVKQDAKTRRPLRGAVFEVWRETNGTPGLQTRGINADRLAAPGCATDRAGVCEFDGLAEGSYYVVETDVPEGYVLPRDRVTGPLRLDRATPDGRLVVTLQNRRDDHGKGKGGKDGKGGKGGHGQRAH
ncbi:choice-of-anchor A family protein [Streptomyces sp. NPDC047014]|uniref:choice-of-anchor A family protein n=1 Tax=Streptomyces sp. NPDC047014 TaxID=3155736 RepID=UPI00340D077B